MSNYEQAMLLQSKHKRSNVFCWITPDRAISRAVAQATCGAAAHIVHTRMHTHSHVRAPERIWEPTLSIRRCSSAAQRGDSLSRFSIKCRRVFAKALKPIASWKPDITSLQLTWGISTVYYYFTTHELDKWSLIGVLISLWCVLKPFQVVPETRAQLADFSKGCSKLRAFSWSLFEWYMLDLVIK